MIGGVNTATSQIASIYNQGNQSLAETLTKIASGKKFQNAGEDLLAFTRASNLNIEINGYTKVKEDLTAAKTISTAAVQVGSDIYESLTEMKDYAAKYAAEVAGSNDADTLAEYKAEFNSLKETVVTAINNAYVDGNLISGTGSKKIVNLDPDAAGSLDMNFTAAANSTSIDAFNIANVTANDISNQINDSLTYMSEAKSFNSIIENQLNLNNTIVTSKEAVRSLITDIDEASEMSKMLDQNVRQQAAMSMLSQANVSRQIVAKLY